MSLDYDPLSPRWRDDLPSVHRELRERAPVHRAPDSGLFCLSRHEDVSNVLRDPRTFSSSAMNSILNDMGPLRPRLVWEMLRFLWRTRVDPLAFQRRGSLISIDPPRHDALRSIVNRGFAPRRIAAWELRARQLVSEALRGLRPGERSCLVERLAVPLPVTLIAEMLGVEPERRADFKRWSDVIIAVTTGPARGNPAALIGEFGDLYLYLRETARTRRRAPREDLVSALVDPSRPDALDEIDVIQFVLLLLVAGNETTTNLIGNAALALLEHEEVLARVAREPALVPRLVEEVLRWEPPVQLVFRQATRETTLHGVRIPKGAGIALLLGSANRDERVFPDPDHLDLDRDPRAHLAFGFGPHFCLGASLARMEARVALEALAPLLPACKLAAPVQRVESFLVRGPARLEVERVAE